MITSMLADRLNLVQPGAGREIASDLSRGSSMVELTWRKEH